MAVDILCHSHPQMVRLINPEQRHAIYDPTVGSGGMLIQCSQFVSEQGGDGTDLDLHGQDNDPGVVSSTGQLSLGRTGRGIQRVFTVILINFQWRRGSSALSRIAVRHRFNVGPDLVSMTCCQVRAVKAGSPCCK
jgi:N-6 DNA Methylase